MRTGNALSATCPARRIFDQLSDKWAALILSILNERPYRFNELKNAIGGISQKILVQTLKKLERNGLVHRQVHDTSPVTVSYSVTKLGDSLCAIVKNLREWAEVNVDEVLESQSRFDDKIGRQNTGEKPRTPHEGNHGRP